MTTRIVELRRGILKKNDELAAGLRNRFSSAGVLVLNLVSSPGTGADVTTIIDGDSQAYMAAGSAGGRANRPAQRPR